MPRVPVYLLLGLTLVACEKIGSGGSTLPLPLPIPSRC